MARVAMIGPGRMGSGMAGRLLPAGHEVVVANRTPGRAVRLVGAGALLAASPSDASAGARAVIVMVSDDDASGAVWQGPDGLLAGPLVPGALAIECSTLSAERVRELAGAAGMRYVDSPVTGLPDAAAAGRLTPLVGAEPADLDAARPFLEPLAEQILHFGPVGGGTAYKLIVNLVGAVQIAAVAEGLALAERGRALDLHQVVALGQAASPQVVTLGQAASPQVVFNSRRMVASDHRDVVFSGRLRPKDADYGNRGARAGNVNEVGGARSGSALVMQCHDQVGETVGETVFALRHGHRLAVLRKLGGIEQSKLLGQAPSGLRRDLVDHRLGTSVHIHAGTPVDDPVATLGRIGPLYRPSPPPPSRLVRISPG